MTPQSPKWAFSAIDQVRRYLTSDEQRRLRALEEAANAIQADLAPEGRRSATTME